MMRVKLNSVDQMMMMTTEYCTMLYLNEIPNMRYGILIRINNFGVDLLAFCVLRAMALRGLKVVELAGLAPAPMAGMILAGGSN